MQRLPQYTNNSMIHIYTDESKNNRVLVEATLLFQDEACCSLAFNEKTKPAQSVA